MREPAVMAVPLMTVITIEIADMVCPVVDLLTKEEPQAVVETAVMAAMTATMSKVLCMEPLMVLLLK